MGASRRMVRIRKEGHVAEGHIPKTRLRSLLIDQVSKHQWLGGYVRPVTLL